MSVNVSSEPEKLVVREITDADICGVTSLLVGGFSRPRRYWEIGLERLQSRSVPVGMPRYGFILEANGNPVGVILLISSLRPVGNQLAVFSNLSSWYVEPRFRRYATLLYRHALSYKNTTYLNISAAGHVRPIIEAFGFSRYAKGQVLAPLALARDRGNARVQIIESASFADANLTTDERNLLELHARYGCIAVCCNSGKKTWPLIFLPRMVKRLIPCAQLAYCRDVTDFVEVAGTVGRYLLRLGRPFVLIDANGPIAGIPGRYFPDKAPRYYKGPVTPLLGDLTETEATIFGI
jgi:hypothetical protein